MSRNIEYKDQKLIRDAKKLHLGDSVPAANVSSKNLALAQLEALKAAESYALANRDNNISKAAIRNIFAIKRRDLTDIYQAPTQKTNPDNSANYNLTLPEKLKARTEQIFKSETLKILKPNFLTQLRAKIRANNYTDFEAVKTNSLLEVIDYGAINTALDALLNSPDQSTPRDRAQDLRAFAHKQGQKRIPNKLKAITAITLMEELLAKDSKELTAQENILIKKLKNAISRPELRVTNDGLDNIIKFNDLLLRSKYHDNLDNKLKDASLDLSAAFKLRAHHKKSRIAADVAVIALSITAVLGLVVFGVLTAGVIPGITALSIIAAGITVKATLSSIGIGTGVFSALIGLARFFKGNAMKYGQPINKKISDSLKPVNPILKILTSPFLGIAKAFKNIHNLRKFNTHDKTILAEKKDSIENAVKELVNPRTTEPTGTKVTAVSPAPVLRVAAEPETLSREQLAARAANAAAARLGMAIALKK